MSCHCQGSLLRQEIPADTKSFENDTFVQVFLGSNCMEGQQKIDFGISDPEGPNAGRDTFHSWHAAGTVIGI